MEQPDVKPKILLFDEFGRPLMIKYPPQKRQIGFVSGLDLDEQPEKTSSDKDE